MKFVFCSNDGDERLFFSLKKKISVIVWTQSHQKTRSRTFSYDEHNLKNWKSLHPILAKEYKIVFWKNGGGAGIGKISKALKSQELIRLGQI